MRWRGAGLADVGLRVEGVNFDLVDDGADPGLGGHELLDLAIDQAAAVAARSVKVGLPSVVVVVVVGV